MIFGTGVNRKMNKIVLTLLVSILLFTSVIADKLTFGGDNAYPPYEFVDKNGKPIGFNVDLMRAVADSPNWILRLSLVSGTVLSKSFSRENLTVY